jgi:predicted permease
MLLGRYGRMPLGCPITTGLGCRPSLHSMAEVAGIITTKPRSIFSRVVTDSALPPLIIETFARHCFELQNLLPALIMRVARIICLLLEWCVGRFFSLDNPKLGGFTLVPAFGSSATLGYAQVQQIMGNNSRAVVRRKQDEQFLQQSLDVGEG